MLRLLSLNTVPYTKGSTWLELFFDLIYVAPPQYEKLWIKTLRALDQRPEWLDLDEGLIVVQIHPKEYQELVLEKLELVDQRTYGSTMLCLYMRKQDEEA